MSTDLTKIIEEIKKLPFNQSWRSSFISDKRKIMNFATGQLEEKVLEDFLYIPAPNIVRNYGSNPKFLAYRNENKFSKDYDYNLLSDKFENNNRRIALKYVAENLLNKLGLEFMIDDAYTIYIPLAALARLAESEDEALRKLYIHFAIPKQLARKTGVREEWGA
jgi:hypothetical protein